jgi:hypothetical protein
MDADLQDSPEEIQAYTYDYLQNFDLVSGWKKKRYDSVVAKTYLQNYSTGRLEKTSGVELNDFNCGLKHIKYSS